MRILLIAHGHPTLSPGGAERAAYSLFEHLKTRPEATDAYFAARAPSELIGHDADFGLFRAQRNEILINLPPVDPFTHQSLNYDKLRTRIEQLIMQLKPDIIHVHHFVFFGCELFEILKHHNIPVVLTLHEFIAICHHYGQMVKTTGGLCRAASAVECSQCFPDLTAGQFFLREQMLKRFLSYVDIFVSPSKFLAKRYINWGIGKTIRVIENPLAPSLLDAARKSAELVDRSMRQTGPIRLGFFGQINQFKGLHVVLEALRLLDDDMRRQLMVGVHGANLELQTSEFQERIKTLLEGLSSTVSNFGAYDNEDVIELMRQYDRIIVPSVWWENSPVVIQEAQLAGVPLICSRIGGMAEKVNSSMIGSHFEPGSAGNLAALLETLVRSNDRHRLDPNDLVTGHEQAVSSIVELYCEAVGRGPS